MLLLRGMALMSSVPAFSLDAGLNSVRIPWYWQSQDSLIHYKEIDAYSTVSDIIILKLCISKIENTSLKVGLMFENT
jgi:hypothetical protein